MIWIAYHLETEDEIIFSKKIREQVVNLGLSISPKTYMSNFEGIILLEVSEVIRLRKGLANIHKEIKNGLLKIIGNYNSETKFKICISLNCQATEWMCLNTKPN